MYTKQEEFLSWLAEVKVRETARRTAGTRFTHARYPRHTHDGSPRRTAPLRTPLVTTRVLVTPSSTPALLAAQGVVYEHCGQRELKEHFDSFCEDYNTATMPSKKYYDLHAWHAAEQAKGRKKKARRAKEGGRARTRGARSGSRACTLTSLPHLATRLALTPPHPPPAPGQDCRAHHLRRRGGAPERDRARPCGAAGDRGQGDGPQPPEPSSPNPDPPPQTPTLTPTPAPAAARALSPSPSPRPI